MKFITNFFRRLRFWVPDLIIGDYVALANVPDYHEMVKRIDHLLLAELISLQGLGEKLDYHRLGQWVDLKGLAEVLNHEKLTERIDYAALAAEISPSNVANQLDAEVISRNVDLDYDTLRETISDSDIEYAVGEYLTENLRNGELTLKLSPTK